MTTQELTTTRTVQGVTLLLAGDDGGPCIEDCNHREHLESIRASGRTCRYCGDKIARGPYVIDPDPDAPSESLAHKTCAARALAVAPAGLGFFSHDHEGYEFELHTTELEARTRAQDMLDEAAEQLWPLPSGSDVRRICWGIVLGRAEAVGVRKGKEADYVDVELLEVRHG